MIQVEGTFVLLAPAYPSTQNNTNTISTSALKLKRYSRCAKASHAVMEYLSITTAKKRIRITKLITVAALDYAQFKLHNFKRPMKTKIERNPHLSDKLEFIFRAGQHPTKSTTVGRQQMQKTHEISQWCSRWYARYWIKCYSTPTLSTVVSKMLRT